MCLRIQNIKLITLLLESISFSGTPNVQSTPVGTNQFVLICRVSGNPKPTLSWNVRGKIHWPTPPTEISSTEEKLNISHNLSVRKVTNNGSNIRVFSNINQ